MPPPVDCVPLLESHDMYDMAAWASDLPVRHGWKGRTCSDLWGSHPEGHVLLQYAEAAGADKVDMVRAVAACVRRALRFVPAGEDRPRLAIEAAERWADDPTEGNRLSAERASADVRAWTSVRCRNIKPQSKTMALCIAADASRILHSDKPDPRDKVWQPYVLPDLAMLAAMAADAHLMAHGWDTDRARSAQAAVSQECAADVRRHVPFLELAKIEREAAADPDDGGDPEVWDWEDPPPLLP